MTAVPEPTIAELRVLMRRMPADGDLCSCKASYEGQGWTHGDSRHVHFPRYPAVENATA